jgi:hypothetical protein
MSFAKFSWKEKATLCSYSSPGSVLWPKRLDLMQFFIDKNSVQKSFDFNAIFQLSEFSPKSSLMINFRSIWF